MYDAERIRAGTFVRHIEIHETLGSTNDRAAELARYSDIELPALVVARLQTAGRGRGRNRWWSADGALTFSLLMDQASTRIQPANWPQLSLASAVAVCDALAMELGSAFNRQSEIRNPNSALRLGVKWPNDVILDEGKVCGILIESPGGAAPAKDRLIIGVGINVNNSWRDVPIKARPLGTALCDVSSRDHDLAALLVRVLAAIGSRLAQLRTNDSNLSREWQRVNVLAGQSVCVDSERHIEGTVLEIASDGALLLASDSGTVRAFSGSVKRKS
jgi:BirA family biotin operon repressor/biotin-[acetyl-CoA-carboxylase] ligase